MAGDNGSLWLGVERPDRAAGPTLRAAPRHRAATRRTAGAWRGLEAREFLAKRKDHQMPPGGNVALQRDGTAPPRVLFVGLQVSKPGFERLDRLWRTIQERKATGHGRGRNG